MKSEKMAMVSVQNYFATGKVPSDIHSGSSQSVVKRLEVLRYGLGARVKKVIKYSFPNLISVMSESRFNEIGVNFTDTYATKSESLSDLSQLFYNFLLSCSLNTIELRAATIDNLILRSRSSLYNHKNAVNSIQQFKDAKVTTQACTLLLSPVDGDTVVISRNSRDVFVTPVSLNIVSTLEHIQANAQSVEEISVYFDTEESLAEFLVMSLRYYWLQTY